MLPAIFRVYPCGYFFFFIHLQDSFPLECQFLFKFPEVNLTCLSIGPDYSKERGNRVHSVSDYVDTIVGCSGRKEKWLLEALHFATVSCIGAREWTRNKDLCIQKARYQLEQIFILVSKLLLILVYYL